MKKFKFLFKILHINVSHDHLTLALNTTPLWLSNSTPRPPQHLNTSRRTDEVLKLQS